MTDGSRLLLRRKHVLCSRAKLIDTNVKQRWGSNLLKKVPFHTEFRQYHTLLRPKPYTQPAFMMDNRKRPPYPKDASYVGADVKAMEIMQMSLTPLDETPLTAMPSHAAAELSRLKALNQSREGFPEVTRGSAHRSSLRQPEHGRGQGRNGMAPQGQGQRRPSQSLSGSSHSNQGNNGGQRPGSSHGGQRPGSSPPMYTQGQPPPQRSSTRPAAPTGNFQGSESSRIADPTIQRQHSGRQLLPNDSRGFRDHTAPLKGNPGDPRDPRQRRPENGIFSDMGASRPSMADARMGASRRSMADGASRNPADQQQRRPERRSSIEHNDQQQRRPERRSSIEHIPRANGRRSSIEHIPRENGRRSSGAHGPSENGRRPSGGHGPSENGRRPSGGHGPSRYA